jgi:hypothetical protein
MDKDPFTLYRWSCIIYPWIGNVPFIHMNTWIQYTLIVVLMIILRMATIVFNKDHWTIYVVHYIANTIWLPCSFLKTLNIPKDAQALSTEPWRDDYHLKGASHGFHKKENSFLGVSITCVLETKELPSLCLGIFFICWPGSGHYVHWTHNLIYVPSIIPMHLPNTISIQF